MEKSDNFIHYSGGFVRYTFEQAESDVDHSGHSAFQLEGEVTKTLYHFENEFLVEFLSILLELV